MLMVLQDVKNQVNKEHMLKDAILYYALHHFSVVKLVQW